MSESPAHGAGQPTPMLTASATAAQMMASLATSDDTAYVLSHDYKLVEANSGFWRFALKNGGGDCISRWRDESVLGAISGPLRTFFASAFAQAREARLPWTHDYECSSTTLGRTFRMTAYPVGDELVVVHALRLEGPHPGHACEPNSESYVRNGLIIMCSNCRRVRNANGQNRWDWVPAYLLRAPAAVSHGLCEPCAHFYWP